MVLVFGGDLWVLAGLGDATGCFFSFNYIKAPKKAPSLAQVQVAIRLLKRVRANSKPAAFLS